MGVREGGRGGDRVGRRESGSEGEWMGGVEAGRKGGKEEGREQKWMEECGRGDFQNKKKKEEGRERNIHTLYGAKYLRGTDFMEWHFSYFVGAIFADQDSSWPHLFNSNILEAYSNFRGSKLIHKNVKIP